MSRLAIFGLKYPSLLKFDENRNQERVRANLRNLYGVLQAPCNTQLRTVLDEVSPDELRLPFISIHQQLPSQKVVEEYRYLGSFLVTLDGTGQFFVGQRPVTTLELSTAEPITAFQNRRLCSGY